MSTSDVELVLSAFDDLSDADLRSLLNDLGDHDLLDIYYSLDDDQSVRAFLLLDLERKVNLVSNLSEPEQEWLIGRLPMDNLRIVFDEMDPDDLVDVIQAVSPQARQALWENLSLDARQETQFLLRFDQDDAAGLMTPRYLAVRPNITVGQTLAFIRTTGSEVETVYYVYVVDQLKRLSGVVSLRDLLFTDDHRPVSDIMARDIVSVRDDIDQEEAARILDANDLIAMPVVDSFNRLLGIITFDDVIDVIREEQTEDVYKMGAMDGSTERYVDSSIWKLIRKRIPWLIILLLAGTITTNVLSLFEPITLAATFLIWFVPVITQTGGNSGTQSSTLMIRGLATGEIHFRDIGRVLAKELAVGILMGLVLGLVILGRGLFLPPGIELLPAIAVGSSLIFVVVFSSLVGALAPLLIHRLGADPT
ncbi:MAG TPA: magnesium transporter, partial [Spirochaetia bacterium]|nr:magnesium transporter [Spirochaetia bacterium]